MATNWWIPKHGEDNVPNIVQMKFIWSIWLVNIHKEDDWKLGIDFKFNLYHKWPNE